MQDEAPFGAWFPSRHRCSVAHLVFLAYLTAPQSAAAQEATDRFTSRESKDFEFVLTMPFLYSSSIVRSDSDTAIGDSGDKHVDPDFAIQWSRQFSHIRLETFVAATLERYSTVREADVDRLTTGVKVELTDGRSDLFVPYFQYELTMDFVPVFSTREDTLHDFAVGFSSGIGFGRDGKKIPYSEANDPGHSSVKFDIQAGRRFADLRDLDRFFVEMNLDFAHTISNHWALVVTPAFKTRWYNNYFGEARSDYRPSIELKAEWTPDWLTRQLPDALIEFGVLFERNYSNLAEQRNTLYEFGPTIILSSKF